MRVLPWNTFFTDIEFWFFYPFNGPGRVHTPWKNYHLDIAGRHEGDWEQVTLRFLNSSKKLVSVYMSAHSGGYWVGGTDWSPLQFEGSHPKVYAAKYSHANYPDIGEAPGGLHLYEALVPELGVYLYDETGHLYSFDTWQEGKYQVVSADMYPVPEPDWLCYRSRWGKYELLKEDIDFRVYTYPFKDVGKGPEGPPTKGAWYLGEAEGIKDGWPSKLRGEITICSLSVAGPDTGQVSQPIEFEAAVVTGSDVHYTWDFGDGSNWPWTQRTAHLQRSWNVRGYGHRQ